MTGVIEDIHIIPFKKVTKKIARPDTSGFSFYINRQKNISSINRQKNIPREPRLPEEQKEVPFDEWIMPVQPDGYIKGGNNDLL
jgi:hypothetical protein